MRVAALAGAVLALTGCVGGTPLPTLPPSPTTTPIFASEEEALAAAEEAYAAYLEVSNLISSEGGVDPERIAPFVTERRLEDELRGFATLREHRLRVEGATRFGVIELQQASLDGEDAEVVFYACWDGSETRVFDSEGEDVTPADREVRVVLEVRTLTVQGLPPLVVESAERWPARSC
jgi:hypothetical protein